VGEVISANSQAATSEQRPCGGMRLERGDRDYVRASTQGMRCKGMKVMWQEDRKRW
jgi:hypothetical protein